MIIVAIKRALRRRQLLKDIRVIKGIIRFGMDRETFDYWSRQFCAKCDEYKSLGGKLDKADK